MRHFSRGFRSRGTRPIIKTYKKVINVVPASYAAGFSNIIFAVGKDSITMGQTSNTDGDVPTGSIIEYVEVQFCAVNLVAAACFINFSLQYTLSGQNPIDPSIIGGSPQRNQVLNQGLLCGGLAQNIKLVKKYKLPKKFQRLREGMKWTFNWDTSATVSAAAQLIYKVKQ